MSESSLVLPPRLPGVFELIDQSVALYRARFNSIALLALSVWAVSTLIFVIVGLAILGLDALGLISDTTSALVYMGIPAVAGGMGALLWHLWGAMALYQAYLAHGPLSLRESFIRARPYILPYLWVGVLALVVQLVLVSVLVGLGVVLGMVLPIAISLPLILLLVLVGIVAYVVVATRLVFSGWCLVTQRGSGMSALKASWHLVAGRTLSVFGRLLGTGLCYLGAIFLINMAVGILSIFIPPLSVLSLVAQILLSPVMGIVLFLLFTAVTDTRAVST